MRVITLLSVPSEVLAASLLYPVVQEACGELPLHGDAAKCAFLLRKQLQGRITCKNVKICFSGSYT